MTNSTDAFRISCFVILSSFVLTHSSFRRDSPSIQQHATAPATRPARSAFAARRRAARHRAWWFARGRPTWFSCLDFPRVAGRAALECGGLTPLSFFLSFEAREAPMLQRKKER